MKTKRAILAILVAIAVAIGVTSVVLVRTHDQPQPAAQNQTKSSSEVQSDVVRFVAEPDKNVLDQLSTHAAIETKSSQYGVYVDSINGRKGGDEGKYWTFYVDGQMAQVGADAYITKGGEVIEWKFE